MILPYSGSLDPQERRVLENSDNQNHKKDRNLYVSPGLLILTSPDGTKYSIEVDNAGALSTTAV